MNIFKEEIKQNSKAVIPIAVLVLILNLFRPVDNKLIVNFLIGCIGVIFGLSIFLTGVDLSISKIGSCMGDFIAKSENILKVIIFGIFIGFIISIAKPDLLILANQVRSAIGRPSLIIVNNSCNNFIRIWTYDLVNGLLDDLENKFDKKNSSIMFTTPVDFRGEINMEYEALYVIVNKENADKVIEISQAKGAKGATVVHGRGSGIQKKSVFLNMTIEPEKDIVIMLIKKEISEDVKSAIYESMKLDENSQGILFSLPVSDVRGLVEQM